MSRSKKFIIIGVVGALLLVASIGGVVYAQTGDGEGPGAMLDKVCEIYQQNTGTTIDQQALKDAFAQAREEMRPLAPPTPKDRPQMDPEATMQDRLLNLVNDGKITQAQADEFTAWLNAKPDTTAFEQQVQAWQEGRPEMPAEMKEWLEAKPDIPLLGFPGHGKFPGPRGFGGPCAPAE